MKVVNQPIMKKDAMALVSGKPVFTNDKAPKECLSCHRKTFLWHIFPCINCLNPWHFHSKLGVDRFDHECDRII